MITYNNITSQSQFIEQAHTAAAIPSMIILFSFMLIVGLFIGIYLQSKKFWQFFALLFVIGFIVLVFLCFSPNFVQTIANLFS